ASSVDPSFRSAWPIGMLAVRCSAIASLSCRPVIAPPASIISPRKVPVSAALGPGTGFCTVGSCGGLAGTAALPPAPGRVAYTPVACRKRATAPRTWRSGRSKALFRADGLLGRVLAGRRRHWRSGLRHDDGRDDPAAADAGDRQLDLGLVGITGLDDEVP